MTPLETLLYDEIATQGSITFARFMEMALYHPTLGYYAGGEQGREPLGWEGDFFTSGDLHPLWGWSIARQLRRMWELLGRPARFTVVEPGGGRGVLARDVWRYALERAPDWAATLRYLIVETATPDAPLRVARQRRLAAALAEAHAPADAVTWLNAPPSADKDAFVGCIISNELVDALPCHALMTEGGDLREVYVASDGDAADAAKPARARFVERLGPPSTPAVAAYLDAYRIPWRAYPDGWRCEARPVVGAWLREASAALQQGFMLTIDYGDSARRLYSRARQEGTLAVYYRHRLGEWPLERPGRQDITAHVNFTQLIAEGRAIGLRLAVFTTQAEYLRRLGIREEAEALANRLFPAADTARHTNAGQADYLRKRSLLTAINTLLDPHGLGGFRVLIQQRGAPGTSQRLFDEPR